MNLMELLVVVCPLVGLGIGIDMGLKHGVSGGFAGGILGFLADLVAYPVVLFIAFIPCMIASVPRLFMSYVSRRSERRSEDKSGQE
jgi:hypothetical protein